jgi:hypothetical protein
MPMRPELLNLLERPGCRVIGRQERLTEGLQGRELCRQEIERLRADLKVARLEAKLIVKRARLMEIEDDLRDVMRSEEELGASA